MDGVVPAFWEHVEEDQDVVIRSWAGQSSQGTETIHAGELGQ